MKRAIVFTCVTVIALTSHLVDGKGDNLCGKATLFPNLISTISGKCECYEQYEEQQFSPTPSKLHGLLVECTNVTSDEFYNDINHISNYFSVTRNLTIYSLQARDCKLEELAGLPPGLDGLKHLTVDNTGIDLEQIRESSESLATLKMFRVSREKFTEIPENFFTDLHGLNVLALNDVGLKVIYENGFRFLEDTVRNLSLRNNLLRSIPPAIATLSYVESIDLTGNQIRTVSDDIANTLESGCKSLSILNIDTIDCTCELSSSLFMDWIRSERIQGVKCATPPRLKGWDISGALTEDLCNTYAGNHGTRSNMHSLFTIITLFAMVSALFTFTF